MRLVDDTDAEHDEIRDAVQAGLADTDAGHDTTVATVEDEQALRDSMMARLRSRLTQCC